MLAQRALDAVSGVDLNPFAVAIARFRLIVAALQAVRHRAAGRRARLDDPRRRRRQPAARRHRRPATGSASDVAAERRAAGPTRSTPPRTPSGSSAILGRQYHVVVGNPPYITVKDAALNAALPRALHDLPPASTRSACRSRSGSSTWRSPPTDGRPAGYVGQITANSFMKREFGKKLIEEFFPTVDLTHVIDTSGAYIPGHGTPTVILFGRNRTPVGDDGARRARHPGRADARPTIRRRGWSGGRSSTRSTTARSQNEFVSVDGRRASDVQQASVEHRRRRGSGA